MTDDPIAMADETSRALAVRIVAKPWGVDALPAPFVAPAGERIGEWWFEPPAALPDLLVKFIFTSEALSVQVHPSDAQTLAAKLGRQGKEECWLVIAAEPDAKLGIGLDRELTAEELRAAALDGSIEQMLVWHPVQPGDFFYIPANTVHAIGAGISLIEVQQTSDITYRLYDYGRPRELHLDEAVAVADRGHYADPRQRHVPARGEVDLVAGPLFRLTRFDGPLSSGAAAAFAGGPLLVVPSEGSVEVNGEVFARGTCALVQLDDRLVLPAGALGLVAQPLGSLSIVRKT